MKRSFSLIFFMLVGLISPLSSASFFPEQSIEVIQGFRMEFDKLIFTVNNKGYTTKESFKLQIKDKKTYFELTLIRTVKDEGKALLDPADIIFTKKELKGRMTFNKPIRILNNYSYSFY